MLRRPRPDVVIDVQPDAAASRPSARRTRGAAWSVAAVLVVWAALVSPYRPSDLEPAALLRLPLEGLILVVILLLVPARARRPVAALAGVTLALLWLLKVVVMGFHVALDRPFDLVADTAYADSAVSLLFDSTGSTVAVTVLVVTGLAVLGVLLVLPLATVRMSTMVSTHWPEAARIVTALVAVWAALALSGVTGSAGPIASTSDARLTVDQVDRIRDGIRDARRFEQQLDADPIFAGVPRSAMLSGLRGKDVLVVFVESYGRFSVEAPSAEPITEVLDQSNRQLRQAGFDARSAFLTSPTVGGVSWLAHATLQSGLWIDSQRRYDRLLESGHPTLTGLFGRAGWRTVMVIPSSERPWPEGQDFYSFDAMYGSTDLGYTGPKFGYAKVPDQYTLAALQRLELAPGQRKPVMAEVDLVSSHTPWTPLPRKVAWNELGDGAVYEDMASQAPSRAEVWSDGSRLRAAYATSVAYSLSSLFDFVLRYGGDDTVLVVVGDHQPNSFVTGEGVSHDVPVSVIAGDPSVIDSIAGWGWQDGLRPRPDAPVWRMDAFRDRFLDAYDTP